MTGRAQRHSRLNRSAALASSAMAMGLLALKGWAALATGSVAMLGSLADTALDLVASLITLYAVSLAARPADDDHRFGHGKAEAIAALMQTLLILGSAVAIAARAVGALLGGSASVEKPEFGITVSVAASVATVLLISWQQFVIRRTGSVAIKADRLHYQADLVLNITVIAALLLEWKVGIRGADAVFGLGIAAWIAWAAISSARHAIDMLMDKEWQPGRRESLEKVVLATPGVLGVHEVKTRSSGVTDFIQFHIWLPPAMSVADAHDIVDDVERRVGEAFPGSEVLVHVDPQGHIDAHLRPAEPRHLEPR